MLVTNLSNIASTLNPADFTCFLYQSVFVAVPLQRNNIVAMGLLGGLLLSSKPWLARGYLLGHRGI